MNKSEISETTVLHTTRMFKIIGDETRFRILYLLQNRELSVNGIAARLEMEQSAVSHQLRKLREAKLVRSRRDGKRILYCQDDNHVFEILNMAITHALHTGQE